MSWILYLLIVLWGFFGILALFFPKKVKDFSLKLTHSAPYWLWGAVVLVVAVLLWRSATLVRIPLVVQILAVWGGIKGLFLLVCPKRVMEGILNYWMSLSDIFYRGLGIVCLLLAYLAYYIF